MLSPLLSSLSLRVLRSPACGWVVRTVIGLASRRASTQGEALGGMLLVR